MRAMTWAMQQSVGQSTAKVVLLCLADHADDDGVCWPSIARIAQYTEVTERTVQRSLGRLEELGLVRRQRRQRESGSQASNWYELAIPASYARQVPGAGGVTNCHPRGDTGVRGGVTLVSGGGDTGVRGGVTRVSPLEPSVEPSIEPSTEEHLSLTTRARVRVREGSRELADYLGPAASVLEAFRARPTWRPAEEHGIWQLYGPASSMDSTVWRDETGSAVPELERPRLLALAIVRFTADGLRFQGHLFRAILRAVVRDQLGTQSRSPPAEAGRRGRRRTTDPQQYDETDTDGELVWAR